MTPLKYSIELRYKNIIDNNIGENICQIVIENLKKVVVFYLY